MIRRLGRGTVARMMLPTLAESGRDLARVTKHRADPKSILQPDLPASSEWRVASASVEPVPQGSEHEPPTRWSEVRKRFLKTRPLGVSTSPWWI